MIFSRMMSSHDFDPQMPFFCNLQNVLFVFVDFLVAAWTICLYSYRIDGQHNSSLDVKHRLRWKAARSFALKDFNLK